MITRPSQKWGRDVREQKAAIAAGTLTEDAAYALRLWSEPFITAVDAALDAYEADVRSLSAPSDEEVFAAVERVITALNAVSDEHGMIETGEREDLCEYVDVVLTNAGLDVEALTSRHDIERYELTDEWRDW
ncbi:hypothetical protein OG777_21975 [Micromonospora peucetia]|nr:hypothetical protein [Micromonospora peucetia]MCX4389578.1 hypothetical protein [Micromonospora peucetia]WSA30063.1 hypothetical protein OIE14_17735 [Micromonospora peucetia]